MTGVRSANPIFRTTTLKTNTNCIYTMHKSFLRSFVLAVVTALALTLSPSALAQLVTSGLTGTVRGSDGSALAGVTVTAVHTPTNGNYTSTTNSVGRFTFRGLPVGGPYTVSAKAEGYSEVSANDIIAELGNDAEVNLTLKSEVLQLEKFVVGGSRSDLDGSASGAGTILDSERLAAKPSSERSLADMISASPMVTLRSTFGDREESQITAVGQNNRYNSITIDGARINDQFGLNGTGMASFFNPLSLDTLEQLSVQLSPYDVRLAGFTGATINAVTKSGTNEYHGSVYYYFRGDSLFGFDLQGPNPREQTLTGAKIVPKLQRRTYGATLGGPIIKNKLFFFLNYEDFESVSAGRDPRFIPTAGLEAQILARLNQYSSAINWGNPVTNATSNTAVDEKIIAKVDWKISDDHRLSVRYQKTEGEVPQFGNFANSGGTNANRTSGIIATSDGHFYSQTRAEEAHVVQLVSTWTPDFTTEIRYSSTKQDQQTPINTIAPVITINGLTGTDALNNTPVLGVAGSTGTYLVGTEFNRHGNLINVDSQQMSAVGDYVWRDFVFTFGAEREQSNFNNLFRNGSFGSVSFASLADFLADTGAIIQRNYYDPAARPVADVSEFATTGIFAGAKWDVSPRLNVNFGIRAEFAESGIKPALNQALLTASGFRNDGSLDGVTTYSPRVGFNLSLDEQRVTQVRGGIGHFLGRSPWVFFSNSFGNTGVGTFTRSSTDAVNPLTNSLATYLSTQFDPNNPIGQGTDNPTLRRDVAFNDDKMDLPSVWRGNIALDRKLPFLDSIVSVELVHSKVDTGMRTTNENLKPTTIGIDGRQRFAGNPNTAANALYPAFINLYRTSNANVGQSTYFSVSWDRPLKNKWGFNLAYTRGRATEAQANGQTTAGGQFNRNVVFNQNTVEVGTADFEIKDRVQLTLTRQFEFVKKFKTTASLYYEGRTGNPYSWVFGGDLNGDNVTFNDTVIVPTGPNDAKFDFSGMTSAQQTAFFAFLDSSGLSKYAGQIVPKNSFTEPWVNKLDLKLVQDIPVRGHAKLQLFFDFVNFGSFISKKTFGYVETSPFIQNDVFRTRTLTATTAYNAGDGKIRPTYTTTPAGFNIDNGMSRWRIQLGAKVLF